MAKKNEADRAEEKMQRDPFVTADGVLHYFPEDGGEIKLPLKAKTKIFKKLRELEEFDALFYLLEKIGDKKTIAQIDELDVVETAQVITRWGEEFENRINAALNRKNLQKGE